MKKVYLDIVGNRHSLYNELVNFPPDGYEFLGTYTNYDRISKSICGAISLYHFQRDILGKYIPINIAKSYIEKFKTIPLDTCLTYSSGHLIFRNEPWVVDLEYVTHLTGYDLNHFYKYKRLVEKVLASESCKKIMPWTNAGKKTVLLSLENDDITDKVETVHLAVHKKQFIKKFEEKKIKILFVGSANYPTDFDIKGGKEVLEAFVKLNREYDNLELIFRSYVPMYIKEKYGHIENITFIENIIPWNLLENEFTTADIFLFPSHNTPGLAILDAMSYELPVITTDLWANSEMVADGVTGYLINKSETIDYYDEHFIPKWCESESLKNIMNYIDPSVVNELVEKTSILIDNEKLRHKMGKMGRNEIENGEFSIEKRNSKLKSIFDEALDA